MGLKGGTRIWGGMRRMILKNARKNLETCSKKQMNLRKGGDSKEVFVPPDADCPLRDPRSQKIPKLTVKAREHCLALLQSALEHQGAADSSESSDTQSLAVEIEHKVFSSSKTANLYKAAVLKKVAEMKKGTEGVVSPPVGGEETRSCSSHDDGPSDSKHDLPSSSSPSSSSDFQGFTPASQMYSLKRKRVGAGLRGSSNPFQAAAELLKSSGGQDDCEGSGAGLGAVSNTQTADTLCGLGDPAVEPERGKRQKTEPATTVSSPATAKPSAEAPRSLNSPSKGTSKKQQKLALAAKMSRSICHYFTKKKGEESTPDTATLISPGEQHKADLESACAPQGEDEHEIKASVEIKPLPKLNDQGLESEEPPAAKRHHPLQNKKKRVTFDTNVQERKEGQEGALGVLQTTEKAENLNEGTGNVGVLQAPEKTETGGNTGVLQTIEKAETLNERAGGNVGVLKATEKDKTLKKASGLDVGVPRAAEKPMTVKRRVGENVGSHGAPEKVVTLKEAADIVVHCLDPFYSQGKFATKDLFKSFARFLSHLLAEGKSCGRNQVKSEARSLIKRFFSSIQRCESESDWANLREMVGRANGTGGGADRRRDGQTA
ncbi:hypothetical protein AGOR_G00224200 [Albula goreensis]|uniref:Uncharacterized protein n=1 Tax=Albula goreensis TaxID=1534307 RepID=A0A8T3CGL8_9TELE|nr:hypothetical protein AGOR_G00224200 [Albula goreensis]